MGLRAWGPPVFRDDCDGVGLGLAAPDPPARVAGDPVWLAGLPPIGVLAGLAGLRPPDAGA